MIRIRPISLRAFDAAGNMLHADLEDGSKLQRLIVRFLADLRSRTSMRIMPNAAATRLGLSDPENASEVATHR